MRELELLSPAKNLDCGIAAINHGADAVYIGANLFGARVAAGNSIEDIEQLCRYAHQYRSKVYITLNTLLTDEQLPTAEKLIHQVYEVGADALIIQDMGILKMNIPPIAIHASTQTDNRTLEKVQFLEKAGFSRVVLARELGLKEISHISQETNIELEAFVHGALCVSYSGQCYISQAICGRSANRGNCAQFCRLPYDLLDAEGNVIVKDKHLLSLKDLNLSDHLKEMADAGVSSFKIEGRLKDVNYVKNITAFYRRKLENILNGNTQYKKSSAGKTTFFFNPNPDKSFNRGFTEFFLNERKPDIIQPNTPKSMGENIGKVEKIESNYFTVQTTKRLNNGDGLCYFDKDEKLCGFKVNKVENNQIYPAEKIKLDKGTDLFRNYDSSFEKELKGKTSERKIDVDILFTETENGFIISLTDEEDIHISYHIECPKEPAKNPYKALDSIKNQLSKLGDTIYEAKNIELKINNQPYFFPSSTLNEWRRKSLEEFDKEREKAYKRPIRKESQHSVFPVNELDYKGNITNQLAEKFYRKYGVDKNSYGFEMEPQQNVPIMFCKHCIKYLLNQCLKQKPADKLSEPLYLRNQNNTFKLDFDCTNCEMKLFKTE